MKLSRALAVAGFPAFLGLSSQAQCTNQLDRFYFGLGAGGSLEQPLSINSSAFGNSGNVQIKPGIRGDIHLGWNVSRSFSTELQTGILWNSIDNIAGNTVSADIYQVPVLANVLYHPFHGAFQPFVGVGCGAAMTTFDSANIPLMPVSYTASDWTFAYQAQLGFSYKVTSSFSVGLTYEFLGTSAHDWSSNGEPLKTSGTLSHSIVAAFVWEF